MYRRDYKPSRYAPCQLGDCDEPDLRLWLELHCQISDLLRLSCHLRHERQRKELCPSTLRYCRATGATLTPLLQTHQAAFSDAVSSVRILSEDSRRCQLYHRWIPEVVEQRYLSGGEEKIVAESFIGNHLQ